MKRLLLDVISYLLLFLFVYAAISKLLDLESFRAQIGQSPLLVGIADLTAWLIPLIEILVSIALVIPRIRLWGLLGSFGLMVLFTAYIVFILKFSAHIPCACGGVLSTLGWTGHLYFNSVFTLLAGLGIYLEMQTQGFSDRSSNLQEI